MTPYLQCTCRNWLIERNDQSQFSMHIWLDVCCDDVIIAGYILNVTMLQSAGEFQTLILCLVKVHNKQKWVWIESICNKVWAEWVAGHFEKTNKMQLSVLPKGLLDSKSVNEVCRCGGLVLTSLPSPQVSSNVAEHLAHSLQDCSNIQEIFQTLYSHGSAISESKIREFEVETERLNRSETTDIKICY